MALIFRKAQRKAVPLLISVASVSGGGKTYSSLLLAAGLAGPSGKVFLGDTETGRGEMYSDSPGIVTALPYGFMYGRIDPPFAPKAYVDLISAAEAEGATVLVIDSWTHEWEGIGGCVDIAENNKLRGMPNWSKAKMEHKKLMNHILSSSMHIILSIRAREKVKMVDVMVNGQKKTEVVPIGLQPITEKSCVFECTVSLQLDEATHFANPLKVPEPLVPLFPGGKLLTKQDGERIRQWNETGSAFDPNEQLKKRARAAADEGTAAYTEFYKRLPAAHKKLLVDSVHESLKVIAKTSDDERESREAEEIRERPDVEKDAATTFKEYPSLDGVPDPFEFDSDHRIRVAGVVMKPNNDKTAWVAAA